MRKRTKGNIIANIMEDGFTEEEATTCLDIVLEAIKEKLEKYGEAIIHTKDGDGRPITIKVTQSFCFEKKPQADDNGRRLSREQQIELMKECATDARGIVKSGSFGGSTPPAVIAAAFFEYRTREGYCDNGEHSTEVK